MSWLCRAHKKPRRSGVFRLQFSADQPSAPTTKTNDQFALWMARLLTAMAASWITSDSDGWAWQ
ncbi:hypothetical protein, partial [Stenotrophomonas sp.]|uniref:hypothetical protein n=1 Tax=Stenotrophomonas sp. TaxID=69392 RepID=UPI0028A0D6FB